MNNYCKVLLCVGFLAGCGGSGSDSGGNPRVVDTGECSATNQKQALFNYLVDDYYWYQDMPQNIDLNNYPTIYELLDSVRVPEDRYSFIISEQQYIDNYVNASSVIYGVSFRLTGDNQALDIRFVYDNGSAHDNGMARGDKVVAIDGVAVSTLVQQVNAGSNSWDNIMGDDTEGYTGVFTWEKPNGEQVVAELMKTQVDTNTLLHHEVINSFEKNVGYMVFNRFIDRSRGDLNVAFNDFAANGVDNLILDMRYNGGGLVDVANQLSTQIAGENVAGETFVNLVYNDKNSDRNNSSLFDLGAGIEQLNLDQVVVLTTSGTCSASEMVVNALSPFVNVVTVGTDTCGKPVGMNPVQICDNVIFAINFESTNGIGQGGYFDGLPATCVAQDFIVGDWGDLNDPLLQEGLYYVGNQQCFADKTPQSKHAMPVTEPIDWTKGPFAHLNVW